MASHVALVGLPGAGKTTVGQVVAARIRCPFIELDTRIARLAGLSVSQIFASLGEAAFRRFEFEATRALLDEPGSLISTGGGWIANPRVRALVPPDWRIIYLRVSAATAAARLAGDTASRPLLAGATDLETLRKRLSGLAAAREALYARADVTIDTEAVTVAQVIDQTAELASAFLRKDE